MFFLNITLTLTLTYYINIRFSLLVRLYSNLGT